MKKKLTPDEMHEFYQMMWEDIHDLVDVLTQNLLDSDDDFLRQKLTEEFRFWRRKNK